MKIRYILSFSITALAVALGVTAFNVNQKLESADAATYKTDNIAYMHIASDTAHPDPTFTWFDWASYGLSGSNIVFTKNNSAFWNSCSHLRSMKAMSTLGDTLFYAKITVDSQWTDTSSRPDMRFSLVVNPTSAFLDIDGAETAGGKQYSLNSYTAINFVPATNSSGQAKITYNNTRDVDWTYVPANLSPFTCSAGTDIHMIVDFHATTSTHNEIYMYLANSLNDVKAKYAAGSGYAVGGGFGYDESQGSVKNGTTYFSLAGYQKGGIGYSNKSLPLHISDFGLGFAYYKPASFNLISGTSASFTYNGGQQHLQTELKVATGETLVSGTEWGAVNTTQTNAGTYSASYELKNGYRFFDYVANHLPNISWTINKASNNFSYNPGSWSFTYNKSSAQTSTGLAAAANNKGSPVSYSISSQINSGGTAVSYFSLANTYQLSAAAGTPAGTYTVNIRAIDNQNGNYVTGDITKAVTVTVNRLTISVPVVSSNTYTYDGASHSITFSSCDTNNITISGTGTATNAGSYSVTATLKDKSNTIWTNGNTNDISYDWTINRKQISVPQVTADSFTYNGSYHSITFSSKDTQNINFTGTGTAVNANSYTYTASLKDKSNTIWTNGNTNDISYNWSIGVKTDLTNVETRVNGANIDEIRFPYDGTSYSPTGENDHHPSLAVYDNDYPAHNLTAGVDFNVVPMRNGVVTDDYTSVGTIELHFNLSGNYKNVQDFDVVYMIIYCDISSATVSYDLHDPQGKTNIIYDGVDHIPEITSVSTQIAGHTFVLTSSDYTVSYQRYNGSSWIALSDDDFSSPGSRRIVITGKGDYSGTVNSEAWNICGKLYNFVVDYMHPEISMSDKGTGECISCGWYNSAKTALVSMEGEPQISHDDLIEAFFTYDCYRPYSVRYESWAIANNDVESLDNLSSQNLKSFNDTNDNNKADPAILAFSISLAGLLAFGSITVYLLKKKIKH